MGPFTVGQIPSDPETFSVGDGRGTGRDLTQYASIHLLMVNPDGVTINESAVGTFRSVDPANLGSVLFDWNTQASVFTTPGAYRWQLKFVAPDGAVDYSTISYATVDDGVNDISPFACWVTAREVSAITGKSVTDDQVVAAQMVIETVSNRTPIASAGMRPRDIVWLKRATAYQTVWMLSQVDLFSRTSTTGISQDGVSATFTDKSAGYLAPLARRSLKNCTWLRSRSLQLRSALESNIYGSLNLYAGSLASDQYDRWSGM